MWVRLMVNKVYVVIYYHPMGTTTLQGVFSTVGQAEASINENAPQFIEDFQYLRKDIEDEGIWQTSAVGGGAVEIVTFPLDVDVWD